MSSNHRRPVCVLAAFLVILLVFGRTSVPVKAYPGAHIEMGHIGTSIVYGSGTEVGSRTYDGSVWQESSEPLNLTGLDGSEIKSGSVIRPGVKYGLDLAVTNTGTINQYVRVSRYAYWVDGDGKKLRAIDPRMIRSVAGDAGAWMYDMAASTPERTVYYYKSCLPVENQSDLFSRGFSVDRMIMSAGLEQVDGIGRNGVKTAVFRNSLPDKLYPTVEYKLDAVQDHNASDAILSAWGRKVGVSDGKLSLS